MGVGEAVSDKKKLEAAVADLTAIAAQKAIKTRAKKSIATYRLREGQEIGTKVTLRGKRMYCKTVKKSMLLFWTLTKKNVVSRWVTKNYNQILGKNLLKLTRLAMLSQLLKQAARVLNSILFSLQQKAEQFRSGSI
mgnify:CR=1 FL=1